ncbi:MAG TPA: lantibiotic dehydratase [Candidatus Angelobacter sp.]
MKEFVSSGFFVLRTPLLPVEDFFALSQGTGFLQALHHGGDLVSAAASDRKLVRRRLEKLADRPEVKEALWLASPEFLAALALWRKDPESEKGKRLEHSLYRYVARMTSRPTPFGLFAGCTLGSIGARTRLEIGPRASYYRRSRLDMEYLCNLADKISSDPARHAHLSFRPNTSLYLAAGRYHHTEGYVDGGQRAYRLVATGPSSYLAATLQRASSGATPSELTSALVRDDPEISIEDAQQYIRRLIESQVLVSDLTPPITGLEPIEDMVAQLGPVEDPSLKAALYSVSERLRKLDEGKLGNDVQAYQAIVEAITALPAEFKVDHLVQVDMMKPAGEVSLDQRLIRSILHAVETLHSLASAPREDPLEQFRKEFRERYQDQEIPLLHALDEEIGIGFERKEGPGAVPEPLIQDLDFSPAGDEALFTAREAEFILLRKLEELAQEKKTTLDLDAALLKSLQKKNPLPLPDAFAVLGSLIAAPDGKENKPSFYLQSALGPSGALLLGRFCHADGELANCVHGHLRAEEEVRASDDVVFAEVAHLPEGRIGNVVYRPRLRHYEIPFLASSRASADRQIAVRDLMVSIENDRITLRSQRLGCEVIPRLTSAHSYTHDRNLKLYKFLCLLQNQGVSSNLSWSWGILDQALFLPRVVLGDVILAPARWRMTHEMIEKLASERGVDRLLQIEKWRTSMGVPRFVLLAEADHQLLIDFENVLSVETFMDHISQRDSARLVEMVPGPDRLCVRGPEGSFTHELVVPLVRETHVKTSAPHREKKTQHPPAPAFHVQPANMERTFLPGSEWLFAKIYASPSQMDHLLLDHMAPLVGKIMASGEADGWFFVRYADPRWHLRLRFHGEPRKLSSLVLPQLWDCLERQRAQGGAWRSELDTYEREVERYGGPAGMRTAERIFQFDSDLALELLAAISGNLGDKIRWRLAFCSVNLLLAGLGFDLGARRQLAVRLGRSQEKEFRVDQRYRKQLSAKFRDERPLLERLLESCANEFPPAVQTALQRFAGRVTTIRAELESLQPTGVLTKTLPELAGSYVHMHLNRMFRSATNAQESVLCHFLARVYESKLAREQQS